MSSEPPPFQEAAQCSVCNCAFNTFRRRHHCRCCGRTLCHEHSSNQMALPQFGIHSFVRACSDCFNSTRYPNDDEQGVVPASSREDVSQASLNKVDILADEVSALASNTDPDLKTDLGVEQQVPECKCGMPLCICEVPEPSVDAPVRRRIVTPIYTPKNSKAKRKETSSRNQGSAANSKLCSAFNFGQVTRDDTQMEYEPNGEGLREAIKNRDYDSAIKLLDKGVDVNYCDKQGMSLLHLAALFNQTDIAFALMERGADVNCKNLHGETPTDLAPATLQYRMQKKIEDMSSMAHAT